jgi:hypothetical protein
MPHAFIAAQFKQLGLDTFTHNFSVKYPLDENEVLLENIYIYIFFQNLVTMPFFFLGLFWQKCLWHFKGFKRG